MTATIKESKSATTIRRRTGKHKHSSVVRSNSGKLAKPDELWVEDYENSVTEPLVGKFVFRFRDEQRPQIFTGQSGRQVLEIYRPDRIFTGPAFC